MAKIFKALSNEQRLKIFKMIYDFQMSNKSSCESLNDCEGIQKAFSKACASMPLSRSTISHHLKELENAGLISTTRTGQCVCCKVKEDAVDAIKDFF